MVGGGGLVFIEGLVVTTGALVTEVAPRCHVLFQPLWLDGSETIVETTRGNLSNVIASMDLLEARNAQESAGKNVGVVSLTPPKAPSWPDVTLFGPKWAKWPPFGSSQGWP